MTESGQLHNIIEYQDSDVRYKVKEALKDSGLVAADEDALVNFAAELVLIAAELVRNKYTQAEFG